MRCTLASTAASISSSHSATLGANGFSTNRWQLARIAACAIAVCERGGVAITTASAASRTSSSDSDVRIIGKVRAAAVRRSRSRSTTVTLTSGRPASTRVCFEPQFPYPMTAISSGRASIGPAPLPLASLPVCTSKGVVPFIRPSPGAAPFAPLPLLVAPTE